MIYNITVIALSVLLIALAIAYPYISAILLKARMLKGIRVTARSAGFKYRRFYKNIFFVRNRSPKYDLIIYDEKRLFAVKLWSSYHTGSTLLLTRSGRVRERRRVPHVFKLRERATTDITTRGRKVPVTRLPRKYSVGREQNRILLIFPSYKRILAQDGKGELSLRTGDELFGKLLYSPSAFSALLSSFSPISEGREPPTTARDKKTEIKTRC